MKIAKLGQRLLSLVYPSRCPFCGAIVAGAENRVCPDCLANLPFAEGDARRQKIEFLADCVSPLYYEGAVRTAVLNYKFHGKEWCGPVLGDLVAQCVLDALEGPFDLVTWAPLGRDRLRRRGYDQARILARSVARALGMEETALLAKPGVNAVQSTLKDGAARRANVLGAYVLRPGAEVAGKRVLLVDDVVTTGATLSECARVLRTAGAASVSAAALAQAKP